jgi:O-antigen ligase
MFITQGRAGQVAFFVILAILIFQYFRGSKIKAILITLFIIPSIFLVAYQISPTFSDRVDSGIKDVTNYSENKWSSVGYRMTFAIYSWEIIKKNSLLGVGTGDFPQEYKKINMAKTPHMNNATNPHNMYILVTSQLGLIGLASFLSIFYFQFQKAFNSTNRLLSDVGFAMPIMFLVIMFSDSYLLGHFTTLMYIFFSSFIYKDYESIEIK